MSKVRIVTDSTNCLPAELIKKYDIRVIPCHIIMDGKDYIDQIDMTPAEFWRRFSSLKEIPTTGVPGPGEMADAYTELAKSTDSIVSIHVSSGLSAIHNSFDATRETLREKLPDVKIEFVDSKCAAGALGFIVLEAVRAAQAGKSLSEVTGIAREMVPRVKWICVLDTLKYLIKGGRAPKTAYIGEMLQIKPIIGFTTDSGKVDSLDKERGKKKAVLKMVDMLKDYIDTSKPLHVIAHYTDRIEDGNELREMVTSRYNCVEAYLTDLTPVMTAHTGPAVALSVYSEK